MKKIMPFILLIFLTCSQGGDEKSMNQVAESIKLNPADIKKLASKKIYFGHMSVGYNIIDGLKSILPPDSGLNIVETSDPRDFSKSVFAHSQIGENCKPETKIADFVKKMESGLGNKVDVAFFKFCYVDVTANADVNSIFNIYRTSINRLCMKYPETKFLHMTVPVTIEDKSLQSKIKLLIKKIIGKKTGFEFDNIRRMEFNNLLRNEYNDSVFDLAQFESTDPEGNEIFSNSGKIKHHILLSQYTSDAGHLNRSGSMLIVKQFIQFLKNNV